MIAILITLALVAAVVTMGFAAKSRDFRKFLAGAFFVSAGVQLYLYLAKVSVPLLGTDYVQTPKLSAARGIFHFILFMAAFYFGFITKPKDSVR